MATRALSWVRKSLHVNSPSHSFVSHSFLTLKHGQSLAAPGSWGSSQAMAPLSGPTSSKEKLPFSITSVKSHLFPAARYLQSNASYTPAVRSAIAHPHCGSSSGFTKPSQSFRCFSGSGIYANTNIKFPKQRRNRGEIKGESSNHICFGGYGLQVLEPGWITSKQILAGQLAIKRNVRGGKLLLRIFPHKPISLKPAETRMGRGKGNIAYWAAGVKPGRILFEISGVSESIARKAVLVAASKMPLRTRFVRSLG